MYNGTKDKLQQLKSQVEEADLRIPMHVLDCVREGYKICLVISNDTDVAIALLYHLTTFLQEGLHELWVRVGRGNITHILPLHTLHARLGSRMCSVLPALHSLTGCDITSKIGSKRGALKAEPMAHLE